MTNFSTGYTPTADELNGLVPGNVAAFTTGGTLAASSGAEAAMTDWGAGGSTTFTIDNGYVYEMRLIGGAYDAGTTGSAGRPIARVRKGINSTSGAIVMTVYPVTAGGSQVMTFTSHAYIKNSTGSAINTKFGLTVTKNTGGNAGLYGDSAVPMILTVVKMGLVSDLTALASIATALT